MRLRLVLPLVLLGLAALSLAALASGGSQRATALKFKAALNLEQEPPHPKATKVGASGHFTATLTSTTLNWKLTFTHLTGAAMAAHIHKGVKGKSGPVIVSLCGPCTSPRSGTSTVAAAEIADLKARKTYVNVHTAKNPDGEVRGQITRAL